MTVRWLCKEFDALTPAELYAVLRLRSEVFVVEQQCVFLEMDNNDQACFHLMGYQHDQLIACTRLAPPGSIYKEASIGRVVTSSSVRRSGVGKQLMETSIAKVYECFGVQPIKIGAQLYLKNFYQSFGFVQISDVYLEDGIEHIYMLKA